MSEFAGEGAPSQLILLINSLHNSAHQKMSYEETCADVDGKFLNVAMSSQETYLVKIGLLLVGASFPCLYDAVVALDDRMLELMDAQGLNEVSE
jgi:hypothetical protein